MKERHNNYSKRDCNNKLCYTDYGKKSKNLQLKMYA